MHRAIPTIVRWAILTMVFCACAHRPSPRVSCEVGFAALSQETAGTTEPMDERPIVHITHVRVIGVDAPLARTLQARLETKVGMLMSDAPLREDLRQLWASGVVADVRVELEGESGIAFLVEPRDAIEKVSVRGGDPAMARRFRLLAGAPFEPARLQRMADAAKLAYVRAGHTEATVDVRQARSPRGMMVCVAANPGPKLTIQSLTFPGRSALEETALISAMHGDVKINRVGGTFDPGALEANKIFLEAAYWDAGHANVRFGEPVATRRGKRLVVEWPVEEGPKFRLGKITIKQRVGHPIALESGELFGRTKIVAARDRLRAELDAHEVDVHTDVDLETSTIDLTFDIQWRWPWQALGSLSSRR